ncbi:hypothetical protein ACTA71_003694 [Dictyostelium dimigraforme]
MEKKDKFTSTIPGIPTIKEQENQTNLKKKIIVNKERLSKNWNRLMQINLQDHLQEYQTLASFFLTRLEFWSRYSPNKENRTANLIASKPTARKDVLFLTRFLRQE